MYKEDSKVKAALALESGEIFYGRSFGAEGEAWGEAVFNTSMSGYQEILTDPSYKWQIIALTYPEIGNYGTGESANESDCIYASGLVVKRYNAFVGDGAGSVTLGDFLRRHQTVAIEGIDTRRLTRIIRIGGARRAVLSTRDRNRDSLVEKAKRSLSIENVDLIKEVTTPAPYIWNEEGVSEDDLRVAVLDFGVKRNILRSLNRLGMYVKVFPASVSPEEVLDFNPAGVFLSNGPGDPAAVDYVVETVSRLRGKQPLFGICFGHQIIARSYGLETYKLKFGHRGANQPVRSLESQRIEITSQNHGFAVRSPEKKMELTHINCNDQTVEGIAVPGDCVFSVQYHPEACPGPRDSQYFFHRFLEATKRWREERTHASSK